VNRFLSGVAPLQDPITGSDFPENISSRSGFWHNSSSKQASFAGNDSLYGTGTLIAMNGRTTAGIGFDCDGPARLSSAAARTSTVPQ
jgi:hypothetical protein